MQSLSESLRKPIRTGAQCHPALSFRVAVGGIVGMKKRAKARPRSRQPPSAKLASLSETSTLPAQQSIESYEYEPLDAQQQHDQEIEDKLRAAVSTNRRRARKKS